MMSARLLPWHVNVWTRLMADRQRLPHALLLQGRDGDGKLEFALFLAQSLLCDTPTVDGMACGMCQSCNWFAQENHPDFRLLEPEDVDISGEDNEAGGATGKKNQISVDRIRDLPEFLGLSSHRAKLRVALLHPAEALNQASANALLKMLEEPPPGVVFLLVSHQPHRLLPTIRSRCNKITMPIPHPADAQAWLQAQRVQNVDIRLAYAGGAPIRALNIDAAEEKALSELQEQLALGARMDVYKVVPMCGRMGLATCVDALQKWIHDLLALRLASEMRYHLALRQSLQGLANAVDLSNLLEYQRRLEEARRFLQHPLNAELQMESLVIQYTQLFVPSSKP